MKVKVIDPKGLQYARQHHAEGAEIEIPRGAHLDTALHFKQVEPVKDGSTKQGKAVATAEAPAATAGAAKTDKPAKAAAAAKATKTDKPAAGKTPGAPEAK